MSRGLPWLLMPSGKTSKQRRRPVQAAPPPVRSTGAPRRRQASGRVLIGATAAVAAITIAVVVAVVLSGGSSNSLKNVPALGSVTNALPGAADVNQLFKGIPQKGTTLGSPSAPVTMAEFIDPQCPYCQQFETQVLPDIIKNDVRTGKLRIQMEPWAFIGPDSIRGQAAELAAAEQNKLFNYAELLYDNQGAENSGWLNDAMVAAVAKSIPGLQVHTLLKARTSATVKAAQKQVDDLATTDKVTGTPTLYVGKTGTTGANVNLASATDERTLVAAINSAE
jgi:protein-disulfide isomerase